MHQLGRRRMGQPVLATTATRARRIWIGVALLAVIVLVAVLTIDSSSSTECRYNEVRHVSGDCYPCPEGTPEVPCRGLIADEL